MVIWQFFKLFLDRAWMHAKSLQSCPTFCVPMDYNLPGSPVHGILQARILVWDVWSSPEDLPEPNIEPRFLMSLALAGGFFTTRATEETPITYSSVQFNSVAQSCPTLCDPMNRSMPGLPVHHQLPEFTLTHVHRVSDAIQPSHPLSSPSPPAPSPFLPTSSLSRVQGYPQDGWCQRMKKDKEIRKSWHRVTKLLWWARPTYFIFREGFCTLSCTYSKVKNA